MSKKYTTLRQTAKTVLAIFGLLFLAAAIAAVIGNIALNIMPCSWFGSSFEGACGIGAVFFVTAAGVVIAGVLSVAFVIAYFKMYVAQPTAFIGFCGAQSLQWWKATFWLAIASWVAVFFLPRPFNSQLICLPFLVTHCYFVYVVAKAITPRPVLWVLVAAALAPIGTVAAFWHFYRVRKTAAPTAPMQP